MASFTAACVQLRSGKDPFANASAAKDLISAAAKAGASYIQTPEMSNILVRRKEELLERITSAETDPFLKMARSLAASDQIYLHIGSLAVLSDNGNIANRSYLIGPDGAVIGSYDKIHMFDVDLPNGESWRESATYQAGSQGIVVELPIGKLGMAICYDIRFPALFRAQARLGADILTAPAAFTRQTGAAHWHVLQRARAIENGAYIVSAAQGGKHEDGRETYGHSVIVDPWGAVVAELDNDAPGYIVAEIDTENGAKARARIPAIANEQEFGCYLASGVKEKTA